MEALEGRVVPTTYRAATVDQLVADIAAVSNSPGPDTILLTRRNYQLAGELRIQNAGDLTIQASNTGTTTISGIPGSRVFEVDGGTVTLQNLTISGGSGVAQGGGIYAAGADLTLLNTVVSANTATLSGAGLFVGGGNLTLTNSVVDSNTVGGPGPCVGGGLAAINATVTVANSEINSNLVANADRNNPAQAIDIGGGIFAQGGTLSITGGVISANSVVAGTTGASAASIGAGIGTSDTTVTINGTKFEKNTLSTVASVLPDTLGSATATSGGSLTIKNASFAKNSPARSREFYQANTTVTLQNSTVDGRKFPARYLLTSRGFIPQR
jgi:hypothetical protein